MKRNGLSSQKQEPDQSTARRNNTRSMRYDDEYARHVIRIKPYTKERMDVLKLLQECNKKNIALKQAFYKSGMTRPAKQLKELSEEEDVCRHGKLDHT